MQIQNRLKLFIINQFNFLMEKYIPVIIYSLYDAIFVSIYYECIKNIIFLPDYTFIQIYLISFGGLFIIKSALELFIVD